MNLLIDSLPRSICIHGKDCAIRWDHRTAILYEMMMLDNEVPPEEKPILALRLFYPIIPEDWKEALEGIQWFYRCGNDEQEKKKRGGKSKQDRIYSFEYDATHIYSAFLSQYNIDLVEVNGLHWWKFRALFQGLNEDCNLCKIMGYRAIDINEVGKEQKEFYRKMKEQYKIPLSRNEQEKQDAIEQALLNGGDLTGLL